MVTGFQMFQIDCLISSEQELKMIPSALMFLFLKYSSSSVPFFGAFSLQEMISYASIAMRGNRMAAFHFL
jgi:hypothetical protein